MGGFQTFAKNHITPSDGQFIGLAVGFLLFVLSWFVAMGGQISGLELAVFRFFNGAAGWVGVIFLVVTLLGSVTALLALTAVIMVNRKVHLAVLVFAAGITTWLAAGLLKLLPIRDRPYELLANVNVLDRGDFSTGFPSAHAALITAVAVILITRTNNKYIKWLAPLAVITVMVSRLVVGVHAPLDVVGGAGLGLVIGTFANLIFKQIYPKELAIKPKTAR